MVVSVWHWRNGQRRPDDEKCSTTGRWVAFFWRNHRFGNAVVANGELPPEEGPRRDLWPNFQQLVHSVLNVPVGTARAKMAADNAEWIKWCSKSKGGELN